MALLYLRARYARELLKLNELEIIRTNSEITANILVSLTGTASALFAWLVPPNFDLLGGFLYITLPITVPLVETHYRKKERQLEKS